MRNVLLRWLLNAAGLLALMGVTNIVFPGSIKTTSIAPAFIVVAVLALLNAFLRPLLRLFTLPLNCLTFGILGIIINLFLFWLAFRLTPGFEIEWSVRTFLLLYLGMTVVSAIVNQVVRKGD